MNSQSNQALEVSNAAADGSAHTHDTAPTRFVEADGIRFAYRRFGNPIGTPIVLLQHLMGNLDNYDPAITDRIAIGREVIHRQRRSRTQYRRGTGDRRGDGAGRRLTH
jgi:pimeloyl-ACP methyl ester carboxylesterase